jgi:hypothetical protein
VVASSELAILISSKDTASAVIDKLGKSIGNVGKAASAPVKALGSLGGAIGDVVKLGAGFATGGLIAQAPGALLDMAKGAAADARATARLSQTLRNLPGDFDQMTGAVNDAISAGQKLAFSDDDIRDSFQFLATATGSSEEALKRQKVALDLARGANIPLAQASKLVGKVNEENVDTFKKLGINIAEGASEAEALAAVQAKFAGQADTYAANTAGQFEQARSRRGWAQRCCRSWQRSARRWPTTCRPFRSSSAGWQRPSARRSGRRCNRCWTCSPTSPPRSARCSASCVTARATSRSSAAS